jgi:hypothetical protein
LHALEGKGIPYAPINNIRRTFEHPQVVARDMIQEVEHPRAGRIKLVGECRKRNIIREGYYANQMLWIFQEYQLSISMRNLRYDCRHLPLDSIRARYCLFCWGIQMRTSVD